MQPSATAPTFPEHWTKFDGHFRQGRDIFTVYQGNVNFMSKMPSRNEAPAPACNQVDADFRRTSWTSPSLPYLIFVPRYNPFRGPLFERLNYSKRTLPLMRSEDGWHLTPAIQQSWRELERALRLTLSKMFMVYPGVIEAMIPFPFPSRFGYDSECKTTREDAAITVMRSRDAFLPLMATITMMFVLLDRTKLTSWRESIITVQPRSVVDRVEIEPSGIHPQWFADLEESAVGDMGIERMGGIIDFTLEDPPDHARRHPMEQLFSCVLERNLLVPLYFCWGAIDAEPRAFIPRILKETHLFPDHHEVAHLSQSPGRVGFSRWEWREEPLPQPQSGYQRFCFPLRPPAESTALAAITGPSVPTASRSCPPCDLSAARDEHRIFPPVEHYSGQKEGEDMHTYFARRAERNKKWAGSEKLDARSSRLARETYAAKGGPPSKKAARVFVWEEEAGFLIRRSVNYTNAADMWDDYSPKQRRYDGFSDEWDLCHEFAPEEDWGADDDDKGYKGYTDPHCETPLPDILLPEKVIRQPSTANDLREIYDLDDTSYGLEDVDEAHPDMAEIPRFRFGFTQPIAPARYQEALRADFLARAVGDEKWPDLRLPKYSLLSVLLAYLLKAKSIQDVPRELLDLRQEGAEIMGHWAVDVRQELLNNQLFYVISLPDTNVHILLQSAATVLQIVRMGWGASSGINEIVAELLARGVQFRLCFQAPLYREPLYQLRQTGLGFRPVGYRPTLVDYVAYQQRLQAFLHSPRGRAALCAGGIIGRLARARVPDDLVLLGPSDEAFQTGVRLWDRRKQTAYWDDALSADDIDLICGVYVTGRVNAADAVRKKPISWWPKPATFSSSGLNIGWWSPDCERWFQKRSREIQSQCAELFTQTEWKHKIRFMQKSRQVGIANENIAAEYLRKRLPAPVTT